MHAVSKARPVECAITLAHSKPYQLATPEPLAEMHKGTTTYSSAEGGVQGAAHGTCSPKHTELKTQMPTHSMTFLVDLQANLSWLRGPHTHPSTPWVTHPGTKPQTQTAVQGNQGQPDVARLVCTC